MTEQLFKYLGENNINNKFTKSLQKGYEKYGAITVKQLQCLESLIQKHKETKKRLDDVEDETEFILSIKSFFKERGFLTPRQLVALNKYN